MAPLSAATYKVTFTASTELRDKLERLKALMRSTGNDDDLASVIEAAVTEKVEKLESKRYGTTKSPRKKPGRDGHLRFVPVHTGCGQTYGL